MIRTLLSVCSFFILSFAYPQTPGYQWAWMGGDSSLPLFGNYSVKGVASINVVPGGRELAAECKDASGNLWMFGGGGMNSNMMNDLWKYNPVTEQWTWISGDKSLNQFGVYGTKGIAAPTNKPGGRRGAIAWINADGDFLLFGGQGYGASTSGYLNDLWKYSPATDQWTWLSGDFATSQAGSYGTMGTPGSSTKPGGRTNSAGWLDASGNVWIFGGNGLASSIFGYLSDLWKYTISTGQWTWIGGSNLTTGVATYGTKGTAAAGNKPGARELAVAVKDGSGNFWLIAGMGCTTTTSAGKLNDVWKFNTTSNQWAWMSGDNSINQVGIYGTKGTGSTSNKIGARTQATGSIDASDNIYIYGGSGYSVTGSGGSEVLTDLWRYNTGNNQWAWIAGNNTITVGSEAAVYGTKGVAASTNKPASRSGSTSWVDASGNFWLLGGGATTSTGTNILNDLWKYSFSTGQWTWMNGTNVTSQTGVYGTKGTEAADNKPGPRYGASTWTDASGNLWLFGGQGYSSSTVQLLNDLWKYSSVSKRWTWVAGDQSGVVAGTYGTKGTAAAGNKPGARSGASSWVDASGNLWLMGGYGLATSTSSAGSLSDMWRYSTTTGEWTWMSGDNTLNATPVYGTKLAAAATNKPGGRSGSTIIQDASGNIWLFGGSSTSGYVNDLWKYTTSTGWWTWMSGDNSGYTTGVYGTKGTPAATNKPGSRYGAAAWFDASGNLFLFGGDGIVPGDDLPTYLSFNDLWRFNVATNQWTWMHGDNTSGVQSVYGTSQTPAAGNKPGSRNSAAYWKDATGNMWLLGGVASSASNGRLNDLWMYNSVSNQWAWMGGDATSNQQGVYGSAGVANSASKPGGRYMMASWRDASGDLLMMGGDGYSSLGYGTLNDLWKYSSSSSGVLPVRLIEFKAIRQQESVLLNWATAQEQNSKSFIIERSVNGDRYEAIGTVIAAGNSDHLLRYAFTDKAPAQGINYYRLKQVDFDGKYVYTQVIQVRFESQGGFNIVQNPVEGNLRLAFQLPARQTLTLQINDMSGNTILSRLILMEKGDATYTLPVSHLAQGTYLVTVSKEGWTMTKKIIKL